MLSRACSVSDDYHDFSTTPQKSREVYIPKDDSREVGESNEPVTFQFSRCVVKL